MSYNIGSIKFTSKGAAHKYTRNVIDKLGINNITEKYPEFKFFCDLIQNHHKKEEKIGCGIKSFVIDSGAKVSIRRLDDSIQSFSWSDCAKQTHKTDDELLETALRSSIIIQRNTFRVNNEEICAKCDLKLLCKPCHKEKTASDKKFISKLKKNLKTVI